MKKDNAKYTVITGASSGIGRAAAKAFARRGKHLIVAARRVDRLESLKAEVLEIFPNLDVAVKVVDLAAAENACRFYEELNSYHIETWINNAGFGYYGAAARQDVARVVSMLRLNVEATAILTHLYVRDYYNVQGAQIVNISSAGGYTLVPGAAAYCASKFFVGALTEALARELAETGAPLRAKVLAPAATRTEFGKVANQADDYDYDKAFGAYHTDEQMAKFLLRLCDSEETVGVVDRETFAFRLCSPRFAYAGASARNQKL